MKRKVKGMRALLTGASSGIGRALARELAKEGACLLLTARRADRLAALAEELHNEYGVDVAYLPGDITDDEFGGELLETAVREFGGLDLLVNNAGAGATERIEETSPEVAGELIDLNLLSVIRLTQRAIPVLRESLSERSGNRRPMIVTLGSIVGLRGTPHYGIYGAAKAGIIAFSDALRAELSREGIDVLCVCPGTTRTEFFDVLLENRSQPHFPAHKAATPEDVARQMLAAIKRGKHRIIPHFPSRILYFLARFFPRFTDWFMGKFA
ncbi:MAG: SDR family NAD(P)-dependent oxidoreductase [Planctomycetia bacterium]|nr:SDR family NAD(P)-dependent oxidoreductase [Planctomycetia bacterium]